MNFTNFRLKSQITYLVPLSYGIPSAFGAPDFEPVIAKTTSTTAYGIIL